MDISMVGPARPAELDYLIRFTQVHETFRIAELEALALLENVHLEVLSYSTISPFCIVRLPSLHAARRLVRRAILVKAIYELWGTGCSYDALHEDVKTRSRQHWERYKTCTFKFSVDSFQGSRTTAEQRGIIEGFHYMDFQGPIKMKNPEEDFCVSEEWKLASETVEVAEPHAVYLSRFLGGSERDIIRKYDLKKRRYISTTSMDSELALVTANITMAAPGKLFYDPFVGTGSFPVACAHFGAMAWGSDIDGRSIRGKGKTGLITNFEQYNLKSCFGDSFVADLTNTPVRAARLFDGIVCDPPYGVREGLKVLGSKKIELEGKLHTVNGVASHLAPGYIPPKKPYSFLTMLDDILDFAALSLVDEGRLSFWMPTSNEAEEEIPTPLHPYLGITNICTQDFNKWSRKLITYQRLRECDIPKMSFAREKRSKEQGVNADDLNPFRKRYFEGFKT